MLAGEAGDHSEGAAALQLEYHRGHFDGLRPSPEGYEDCVLHSQVWTLAQAWTDSKSGGLPRSRQHQGIPIEFGGPIHRHNYPKDGGDEPLSR